jgi:hypothetical protein
VAVSGKLSDSIFDCALRRLLLPRVAHRLLNRALAEQDKVID